VIWSPPATWQSASGTRPDSLIAERVSSIYSVSDCISDNFTDYINFWKYNGYLLFDSPAAIIEIARENGIDLAETRLFFYEIHQLQFDSGRWIPFEPSRRSLRM
jgi:hypothetical protein